MLFYERAKAERERLEKENALIQKKLEDAPEGLLRCKKDGNTVKWFHRTNDKKGRAHCAYLRKQERKMAQRLAVKTYYLQRMKDNEAEIRALCAYLKRHPQGGGIGETLKKDPAFMELLGTNELERELAAWKEAPYEKNPRHEENLKVRAMNGEMVRSKSEAFILSSLATAGIPVRYECRMQLGDVVYYPDFTIRRPSDGKLILWEHFGLMSEYGYMKTAQEKIRTYITHGFYPMENLITTFENAESTLDFARVMDLVEWLKG